MSKIIFLGGIHGTGKGFLSEKLCSNLSLQYLSASGLIKWAEINSDAENKLVNNISGTQERLISALKTTCKENQNYLLDGHYCLLNSIQEPTKVNFEVFSNINPMILLIVTAETELIRERLMTRDGKDYDISLITRFQALEKSYAKEISSKLNVPLYFVDESNINDIAELINPKLK